MGRGDKWGGMSPPDMVDVRNVEANLGEDFGAFVRWEVYLETDFQVVICRCYLVRDSHPRPVAAQALSRVPLKSTKPLVTRLYSTAFDCWVQLDQERLRAGGAPLPPPGISHRKRSTP